MGVVDVNKIGAMTCAWNEEATIVFTIGSLINHVDHYVVADTGSTDNTVKLIESIFEKELNTGKLILLKCEKRDDWDISIPKNLIIEKLKELGCSYFIRLDADDVMYDGGAQRASEVARKIDPIVTSYTINHWELYQNKAIKTKDWLEQIKSGSDFYCMRMPPGANPTPTGFSSRFDGSYGHARIYKVDGAVSIGKWTDEAWRVGFGEDIHHPSMQRKCIGTHDELIVHYGWARPMIKKMIKGNIWSGPGKADEDPRICRLEKEWETVGSTNLDRFNYGLKYWPRRVLFNFYKHPEVFSRLIDKVEECLN